MSVNPLTAGLTKIASGGAKPAASTSAPAAPSTLRKPWEIIHAKVPPEGVVRDIPRSAIIPDPEQPRKEFKANEMADLVDSMRQDGQLVDLIVYAPFEFGQPFVIQAGERRWRASELVPLDVLRCRVKPQPQDKIQQLILALIDGLHRADLSPIDAARSYKRLEESGMSQVAIAKRLSIPRPRVNELIKVMDLGEEILAQAQREGWTAQRLIQTARASDDERKEMTDAAAKGGGLTGVAAAKIRSKRRPSRKGTATRSSPHAGAGSQAQSSPASGGGTGAPWTFQAKSGVVVTASGASSISEVRQALAEAQTSLN